MTDADREDIIKLKISAWLLGIAILIIFFGGMGSWFQGIIHLICIIFWSYFIFIYEIPFSLFYWLNSLTDDEDL